MTPVAGIAASPSPERPERSRNAKAQARHRAKRKAYIHHLEQNVAKLQTLVGVPDHAPAATPLARIKELEDENARLRADNDALRRQLDGRGAGDASYALGDTTRAYTRRFDDDYQSAAPRYMTDLLSRSAPPAGRPLLPALEPRTTGPLSLPAPSASTSTSALQYPAHLYSTAVPNSPSSSSSASSPFSTGTGSPLVLPSVQLPGAAAAANGNGTAMGGSGESTRGRSMLHDPPRSGVNSSEYRSSLLRPPPGPAPQHQHQHTTLPPLALATAQSQGQSQSQSLAFGQYYTSMVKMEDHAYHQQPQQPSYTTQTTNPYGFSHLQAAPQQQQQQQQQATTTTSHELGGWATPAAQQQQQQRAHLHGRM